MRLAPRLTLSVLLIASFAALVACDYSEPQDEEEARAKGRDTDETVFDDMIQTQDKARAVEDLTLGRKADMDAAIEQSSEGAPADE
jgi:hypothetical protein